MGILLSKLNSLLDYFRDNPARVLMLGLDAAGKTTILYRLMLNETVTTIPTIGVNVETITLNKELTFTLWEISGGYRIRELFHYYFPTTQALIYVVDSNAEDRLEEAREMLCNILEDEEMRGVPVVVLANKQDLPSALSTSRIADALQLHKLQGRKWHIQATCAQNGEGLYEAMEILGKFTKEFKQRGNS